MQMGHSWFSVLARGGKDGSTSESLSPGRSRERHVTFSNVPESPRPRSRGG